MIEFAEKIEIDMSVQNRQAIIEAAEALYDQTMPYHNFNHINDVLSASDQILNKCKQESIEVDADVVFFALLFHDAGYHENHEQKGFESKEAYSAHLAETVLTEHTIDTAVIEKIKQAILCTHQNGSCNSNEDRVVKNSDLSGLCSDYSQFKQASIKLLKEHNLLYDEEIDWQDWKQMAATKLEHFLDATIFLTSDSFDENGNCLFIENTRKNIQKLLAD